MKDEEISRRKLLMQFAVISLTTGRKLLTQWIPWITYTRVLQPITHWARSETSCRHFVATGGYFADSVTKYVSHRTRLTKWFGTLPSSLFVMSYNVNDTHTHGARAYAHILWVTELQTYKSVAHVRCNYISTLVEWMLSKILSSRLTQWVHYTVTVSM